MPTPKLRFKDENGQDFPEYSRNFITKLCSIKNGNINAEDGSDKGSYRFFDRGIESVKFADSYFLDKEAIIYAGEGSSFLPKYYFGKFALHQRCYALYDFHNSIAVEYVYQYLLTKNSHFIRYAVGSTVKSLRLGSFNTCEVIIPCLDEQHKIAEFLSTVDEKVEVLEKKLEALNSLKKVFMQKIFSQELRFKDDSGQDYPPFRDTTIGEEGYFYYGKSAPKWSLTDDATTPCVRYGELYTTHKYQVKEIHSFTNIPVENLKLSKGGEVLIPRVGEEPLDFCKCAYLPFANVAIGEMISVYNTNHNPLFISYMFNATMKKEFAKRVEGGNVSNLYYYYLEDIKISVPCLEEQHKIAEFLSAFDEKIEAVKRQVEAMKQVKKGLLQQMFV